jgi:hypothetical protein
MEISFFFAKLWGLFFGIMGLFIMFRAKALHEIIDDYMKVHAATFMGGFLNLTFGLIVILMHNVWSGAVWVIAVTVIGWLALLKGVFYLFAPHSAVKKMLKAYRKKESYALLGLVTFVIGIYLAVAGFGGI